MVSGLVTSPCDQLRIFSGEARLMRIASKSAIGFARSNGLERNKVSSTSRGLSLPPAAPYYSVKKMIHLPTRSLRPGGHFDLQFGRYRGADRYRPFSFETLYPRISLAEDREFYREAAS